MDAHAGLLRVGWPCQSHQSATSAGTKCIECSTAYRSYAVEQHADLTGMGEEAVIMDIRFVYW